MQYPKALESDEIRKLINDFDARLKENQEVSTDQLLNAIFLTVAVPKSHEAHLRAKELEALRESCSGR